MHRSEMSKTNFSKNCWYVRSHYFLICPSQNLNSESEALDEGHNNYKEIKSCQQIWEADFR
jgi:hypothetical protein